MYTELIEKYSIVGDLFLVLLGILFLLILKETYVKREKRSFLFILSLVLVTLASASNVMFCFAVKREKIFWIYFFRDIYHCAFLMIFLLYTEYLILLISPKRSQGACLKLISLFLNVTGAVMDCLSPLTHIGFYLDEEGLWQNVNIQKPFTIAYLLNYFLIAAILIVYRKRIIPKVRKILYITEIMCVAIVVVEDFYGHNSFLSLTFAMPIIVIVFMLHSNSYALETGALDLKSMENYLLERREKGKKDVFLCLRLNLDKKYGIPEEFGKVFYNFKSAKFRDAILFNPYQELVVLAVKEEKNSDIMQRAETLVRDELLPQHGQFHLDFKIVVMEDPESQNMDDFMWSFDFYAKQIALNTYLMVYHSDFEQFSRSKCILKALQDIKVKEDLEDERVLLYCQPVKNVHTGRFDTAEALMRLDIPGIGFIMPGEFIPLAEESDCIHALSKIILNKSCILMKRLLSEGFDWDRISVNFSMTELKIPSFMADFETIVSGHGISFRRIGVELTESNNDTDYNIVAGIVAEMRRLGSYLYLDDFGTGYSNLERLLGLNFNVVKFDRSLLLMTDDEKQRVMLHSLSLAFDQLGYELLYEGVETEDQELLCMNNSASYLQGFKYSRPIPADDLDRFLIQHGTQQMI